MDHSGQRRAKQYAAIQNWLFVGQTAAKLTAQHLAVATPQPVIEFLRHDHPSLGKRIQWAEQWPGA